MGYEENINPRPSNEHIDAINQVFAEFELIYHNQFHKAFHNEERLLLARRLWLNNLKKYSPELILKAAHRAIKDSEYLPTIRGLLKYLEDDFQRHGLPDAHSAYIEACRAPSPKAEFTWRHPAVYYAGKASDWFFLANSIESKAFPVFERNYQMLCERVLNGETLENPLPVALPAKVSTPLDKEEQKKRMAEMRKSLKI